MLEIHPHHFVAAFEEIWVIIKNCNHVMHKYVLMSIKFDNVKILKIKIKYNRQTDSQFTQFNVQ